MKEKCSRRAFLCGCGVVALGALISGCEFPDVVAEETTPVVVPTSDTVQATGVEGQGAASSVPPTVPPTVPAAQQPTQAPTASPTAVLTQVPAATATVASAPVQVLCPFGLVNDPYPGRCRRYVDKNGNGICDWSEPA